MLERLFGFIRRMELKANNEQKVENIFVAPPYCQTTCCAFVFTFNSLILV